MGSRNDSTTTLVLCRISAKCHSASVSDTVSNACLRFGGFARGPLLLSYQGLQGIAKTSRYTGKIPSKTRRTAHVRRSSNEKEGLGFRGLGGLCSGRSPR